MHRLQLAVDEVVETSRSATLSLGDRIARLQQWRDGWRNLQLSNTEAETIDVDFSEHCSIQTCSGSVVVYKNGDEEQQLHFLRLPSRSRGIVRKEWTLEDLPEFEQFDFDYAQDLLVLIK